jgi:hypothetical protein
VQSAQIIFSAQLPHPMARTKFVARHEGANATSPPLRQGGGFVGVGGARKRLLFTAGPLSPAAEEELATATAGISLANSAPLINDPVLLELQRQRSRCCGRLRSVQSALCCSTQTAAGCAFTSIASVLCCGLVKDVQYVAVSTEAPSPPQRHSNEPMACSHSSRTPSTFSKVAERAACACAAPCVSPTLCTMLWALECGDASESEHMRAVSCACTRCARMPDLLCDSLVCVALLPTTPQQEVTTPTTTMSLPRPPASSPICSPPCAPPSSGPSLPSRTPTCVGFRVVGSADFLELCTVPGGFGTISAKYWSALYTHAGYSSWEAVKRASDRNESEAAQRHVGLCKEAEEAYTSAGWKLYAMLSPTLVPIIAWTEVATFAVGWVLSVKC